MASPLNARHIRRAFDSRAVLAFGLVLLIRSRNDAAAACTYDSQWPGVRCNSSHDLRLTALEVSLGVDALPATSSAAQNSTDAVVNWTLRLGSGEVALVVTLAGTGLVDTALPVAISQGPGADTLDWEQDGERSVTADIL